ncbi:MAG: hypothetical protein M1829_001746 [Trizodia sp. TS-e1964]|nr:MAG: hypothetical protein M1829_001746 [Trizodia sp. TS-e1964]
MSFGKLYTSPANIRATAILAVAKANDLKLDIVEFDLSKGVPADYLELNGLGKIPTFQGSDGYVLSECIAIAIYITSQNEKTTLLGKTKQDYASILRWMSFANHELISRISSWVGPLMGRAPYNKKNAEDAQQSCLRAFSVMEKHLHVNTYLVGQRLTLADLFVTGTLARGFQYVFDAQWRESYPNVTRWYETIYNQPIYSAVVPKLSFIDQAVKYQPPKKEAQPKKEATPKAAPQPKAKEADDDEEEETKPEPKAKHPLEALPKPTLVLDDWKRKISNEDARSIALPWFWENYKPDEYSLWRVDYKYPDELALVFMSSNLVNGFFNRLEASRKFIFGALTVYLADDKTSYISGAFVIRGQDAEPAFDVAPDFESYEFTKLDHTKKEDREFVDDQWSWDKPLVVKGKTYEYAAGSVFNPGYPLFGKTEELNRPTTALLQHPLTVPASSSSLPTEDPSPLTFPASSFYPPESSLTQANSDRSNPGVQELPTVRTSYWGWYSGRQPNSARLWNPVNYAPRTLAGRPLSSTFPSISGPQSATYVERPGKAGGREEYPLLTPKEQKLSRQGVDRSDSSAAERTAGTRVDRRVSLAALNRKRKGKERAVEGARDMPQEGESTANPGRVTLHGPGDLKPQNATAPIDVEQGINQPKTHATTATLPPTHDLRSQHSLQSNTGRSFAVPEAEPDWGPGHPCFPHRNPHVSLASPLYTSTRIIRIKRDWLMAGDLAPTFSNIYPEVLDPHVPEEQFRSIIKRLNEELTRAFSPWTWRAWVDAILGLITLWLWDDLGLTGTKAMLRKTEAWLEELNRGFGEKDVRIIPLRRTGYMTLDIQIPDPHLVGGGADEAIVES